MDNSNDGEVTINVLKSTDEEKVILDSIKLDLQRIKQNLYHDHWLDLKTGAKIKTDLSWYNIARMTTEYGRDYPRVVALSLSKVTSYNSMSDLAIEFRTRSCQVATKFADITQDAEKDFNESFILMMDIDEDNISIIVIDKDNNQLAKTIYSVNYEDGDMKVGIASDHGSFELELSHKVSFLYHDEMKKKKLDEGMDNFIESTASFVSSAIESKNI